MKFFTSLVAALVLSVVFVVVLADEDDYYPCDTDRDCKWDECCVLSFTGEYKVCREIGDDLHEPCGGLYFCPVCEGALKCVTVQQVNEIGGCAHPANGTCEVDPTFRRSRPRP